MVLTAALLSNEGIIKKTRKTDKVIIIFFILFIIFNRKSIYFNKTLNNLL